MISSDTEEIVDVLSDPANAVAPSDFPIDRAWAQRPGMYAWWGDQEAQAALSTPIDLQLGPLLYVGQAGATKWPSGKRSSATLDSRIGRQHIRGNTRSSTFRRTLSALLLDRLSLVSAGDGRLDSPSNAIVSAWIAEHLRVGIAPFDDRDSLGLVEKSVLDELDPPLNLGHCVPSDSREKLTALRGKLLR